MTTIRERCVEVMARAICRRHATQTINDARYDEYADEHWDEWEDEARDAFDAAIAILREPSEEMWAAGYKAGGSAMEWTGDAKVHHARESFVAMIDEAAK